MSTNKIIAISLIAIVILASATVFVSFVKPKMHKTIMLEQIIYKRVK